ncbi:unnamed protein product [[Candida] boidinii]|uniref:Unnamed protein product n=1 Tax=Candida boidinii TaxID=5477 RepID=A0ACB5TFB7_CANBO|nr:unnamed protein product [[Candida] boidinii]
MKLLKAYFVIATLFSVLVNSSPIEKRDTTISILTATTVPASASCYLYAPEAGDYYFVFQIIRSVYLEVFSSEAAGMDCCGDLSDYGVDWIGIFDGYATATRRVTATAADSFIPVRIISMTELVVDEIGLEIIKPNQEYVSYYDLVYNGESACPSSSSSLSSASRSISLSSSSASQSSSPSSSSSASASASLSKASSNSSVASSGASSVASSVPSLASPVPSSAASSGASSVVSSASSGASSVVSSASSVASSAASSVASSAASSVASSVASSDSSAASSVASSVASSDSSAASDGSPVASSGASSASSAASLASSVPSSPSSNRTSDASSIGSSTTTLTTYVPCPECTDPYTYTTETVITAGTAPVTVPEVVIGT